MNIRPAQAADAPGITRLLHTLGYPATGELVHDKLLALMGGPHDTVLVALADDPHDGSHDGSHNGSHDTHHDRPLLGLISLHALELFHAPGRLGRITALVVADDARGQGVGAGLVDAADRWFRAAGCVRAEVTSGDHRPQAHAFYEAMGYLPDERRFMKHLPRTDTC